MCGFVVWKITTQPPYDHSQDAKKAQLAKQLAEQTARTKCIDFLSQPSHILKAENEALNEVFVVVKTVWDENLGAELVIGEATMDKPLLTLIGKPGVKFVVGEKVQCVILHYNQWVHRDGTRYQGEVIYFVPFPNAQPNVGSR